MVFNSIDFLIFYPIVIVIYFVIPKRIRYLWLLSASYYFYMSWNPKYVLLMLWSTLITWGTSFLIEKFENEKKFLAKKICLVLSLVGNLTILCLFKYTNFILENINLLLNFLGITFKQYRLDLLLPVGISFYTFQALSYILDVYKGTIRTEKNLLKYMLYVSFFPQLVAGPIERSKNLLGQIQTIDKIQVWNYERIRDGFLLMMWGLFQKLVIADRAAILVNNVINNYQSYGFIEIAIAASLFAIQIYCDFGGYTDIARGSAKIMGFRLMKNFKQPYFAIGIKDFWRRWHISLTSWFTDYVYIPLGGNRKGMNRKYLNILIVFVISGLWHGASWNFVVWGILHAIFQILEDLVLRISGNDKKLTTGGSKCTKALHIFVTFILVDFAWIFFVSKDLLHAFGVVKQMFTAFKTTSVFGLGLNWANWLLLILGIFVLLLVDWIHERDISFYRYVNSKTIVLRWVLYLSLICGIIMFGIYGVTYDTSTFIYFQF